MQSEDQMLVRLFAGLAFIVLLIIMVLLFLNFATSKTTATPTQQPTTIVTHNYNTYNTYNQKTYETASKTYIRDRDGYYYYKDRDGYYCTSYRDYDDRDYNYLRYRSTSDHDVRESVFGNEVHEFKVWVENRDYESGYFTVKFYFTDYYGDTKTEKVRHYIRADQEKRFLYMDVLDSKYKYRSWKYKVISETERPDSRDRDYRTKEVCYYK